MTGDLENGKLIINHDVITPNMSREQLPPSSKSSTSQIWTEPGYSKLNKEPFEANLIY